MREDEAAGQSPGMADQSERAHHDSYGATRRRTPVFKIATVVVFLLIAGSLVLFFTGIFNFGYSFGPAILGIGIVLFVLTLLFSGLFWACVREKCGGNPLPRNSSRARESLDENAISVINPHFDMCDINHDLPPDYWAHIPASQFSGAPKDFQHGRHQQQTAAVHSEETPAWPSPPYEGPPPSYWEALRTDH